MDKKSIVLGILFLVGGFALMTWNGQKQTEAQKQQLLEQAQENEKTLQESGWKESIPVGPQTEIVADKPDIPSMEESISPDAPSINEPDRMTITLSNPELSIQLSNYGGAIDTMILNEYPAQNPHYNDATTPVSLNAISNSPALALNRSDGQNLIPLAQFYELVDQTPRSATFRSVLSNGLVVERTYSLNNGEDTSSPKPYTVSHQTIVTNPTTSSVSLDRIFLDLGTAAPTAADYTGFNLNASYSDNGSYHTIPARKFSSGGFLGKRTPKEKIAAPGIINWGAVKNQFFVTIFTPEVAGQSIVARGIRFPQDPATGKVPIGINAAMEFAVPSLQPGEQYVLEGHYYAGPKSLDRLSQFEQNQSDVMQLEWFMGFYPGPVGFVAKMLLTLLTGLHGLLGNWGIAIILTTFIIRLCLWPLTAKAARASKRMQKLQKPIQELREKYQDNPQKMNQEMMELWKKHKINPLAGCWPVLLQFPIFIAFFNLLRNSSDLRFAEFLWIHDLSMPDATIQLPGDMTLPFLGAAINVLPFIWIISMHFQMKMMPQPSIDNAQTKMIKWMPFLFFPFTYYFSSGLVLYWTTTNCFSIFQQWTTNRKRDQEDIAIEEEIAEMEDHSKGKLPSGPLISKRKKSKKKDGKA